MSEGYTEYDGGMRRCRSCRRYTVKLEAELRCFNEGRCGCGGWLDVVMDRDYNPTAHHDPGDECREFDGKERG